MFTRQVPPSTILLDAQSMTGRNMPSEHLAAPAAIEADDIIAMNRSPDRYGGGLISLGFDYRFSDSRERLMDGRDQRSELVGPDLVSPNISGDDVGRECSVEH
jgi:hypothetical protein